MVDGLDRLGHDAVVSGHDEHGDIRDPRATSAHRGEGLVAGRVEEDDAAAVVGRLAGADVLGDAASLALRDRRLADRVEQARLAMVDVAHDRDDRRTLDERGRVLVLEQRDRGRLDRCRLDLRLDGLGWPALRDREAELLGHEAGRVAVDGLVDRREDAALDELADDVRRVDADELGELLDGDGVGDLDRAARRRIGDLDGRADVARPLAGLAGPARHARAAAATRHGRPPRGMRCWEAGGPGG